MSLQTTGDKDEQNANKMYVQKFITAKKTTTKKPRPHRLHSVCIN